MDNTFISDNNINKYKPTKQWGKVFKVLIFLFVFFFLFNLLHKVLTFFNVNSTQTQMYLMIIVLVIFLFALLPLKSSYFL